MYTSIYILYLTITFTFDTYICIVLQEGLDYTHFSLQMDTNNPSVKL